MDSTGVILMLSGGRDSFLSACRILEDSESNHLYMVTYEHGCICNSGNAKLVAERLIKKYGTARAEYLGVYDISVLIREFVFPYFNMKPAEQLAEFSGMTPSQFHCMVCRTGMYIYSIWLAKRYGAKFVAEGGRRDQQFVIELPGMAKERFPKLVSSAGLELLLPVYDLNSNWIRDNELLSRGFLCKSYEPKCLIGVPVNGSVDDSVIEGVHAYFDKIILRVIKERNLLSEELANTYLERNFNELE